MESAKELSVKRFKRSRKIKARDPRVFLISQRLPTVILEESDGEETAKKTDEARATCSAPVLHRMRRCTFEENVMISASYANDERREGGTDGTKTAVKKTTSRASPSSRLSRVFKVILCRCFRFDERPDEKI